MNDYLKYVLLILGAIVFVVFVTYASGLVSFDVFLNSEFDDGLSGNILTDSQDRTIREITLEAWKYDWSEPTITVKSGELVRIVATSRDVTHGMSIPDLRFNLRIESGKTTVGEFIAPAPGEYAFGCSVMCGPGHHNHKGTLIVLE